MTPAPPDRRNTHDSLTVVLPFYNEENYLDATLASLAAQILRPARLILVDNGSTDGSEAVCEAFRRCCPEITIDLICERRPGKIMALETGFTSVATNYVAFCDADTVYPPHYFQLAFDLIERSGCVGAMGLGVTAEPGSLHGRFHRWKGAVVGALLARQCHTGGFGQIFQTDVLRRKGGYSRALWPYMQADHEVVHRVLKAGRLAYHPDLWCRTSARRTERKRVSWTLFESIVYHLTPFAFKDWFFYRFLARRFEARKMMNVNLRAQPWNDTKEA